MDTLIVGSGYAGLNAYHLLKSTLISDKSEFIFYTAAIRNIVFGDNLRYSKRLPFVKEEKVVDFDLKSKWIKTNKNEYNPENLIIAAGCDKTEIINAIMRIKEKSKISIGSEDPLIDYLVIQLAFYFKKLGKEVKYHGNFLNYLGENISSLLMKYMDKYGIKYTERPEDIIPSCKPSYPFEFYKVDQNLRYQNSFVLGDLIDGFPKLGELAMRTGIYVANFIKNKEKKPFKPIFITIIDTGKEGIHIRSNKLWGGNLESVKISKIRKIMKRIIERYYLIRNGKMGLLYYL